MLFESINEEHIKIPALCKNIGDIEILIWFREITVRVGKMFHTHFEIWDPTQKDAEEAVDETIEFIQDIMNDTLLFKVRKHKDRIISTSIVHKDDPDEEVQHMVLFGRLWRKLFPKNHQTILCSWSGVEKVLETK